jgi:hypothetical protein
MPRRGTPPRAAKARAWASKSISWLWEGYAVIQNARLAQSFRWATSRRRRSPPTNRYSTLQSNWNASPRLKLRGTKPGRWGLWSACARQRRTKAQTRL